VREIVLDAGMWIGIDDFYAALLPALGAPDWHGRNLNALADSMVTGGINAVEPPYAIRLIHTQRIVEPMRAQLRAFLELIETARGEGIDIHATAEPPL
jgi:RNAse (barnase) inhibitor barstar